jgi:hypothetical protein
VALPNLVPHPCRCAAKGKASAQFGDFGRRGDFDNDEIRLTSANQFKIGWDSGDLRTRARGPRAQCSLTQRTDGSPKMVGYRQAVSAAERSYCKQGRRLAAFHIAWLQSKGTGIGALEAAELENGNSGISANHSRLLEHAQHRMEKLCSQPN